MSRRFVTKREIDVLADRGETVLEIDSRTTVTDVARDHAMRRGVQIVRVSEAPPASDVEDVDRLRAAVRSGVLAVLGEAPAGLDEALDRVLKRP